MPKVIHKITSRPPWERMMRLHEAMHKKEYPNCAKLARELEVHVRTIKRDIDFMKWRLNLPIQYDPRRYGYYYTRPVKEFSSLDVSESELFALLVAGKAAAQYHGTELHKPLETAFRKLTRQLDRSTRVSLGDLKDAISFRPFAPEDADPEAFQRLTTALKESQTVTFNYRNLGAKQALRRHVHPYHLAYIDNHWYLFAFDTGRHAMRTFVLARMSQLKMAGGKFKRQGDFDADNHLRNSFQVYTGRSNFEVVIEFDNWATDLLRDRKWHASQEITPRADGGCRVRMRLNSVKEVEGWILSWGCHAKALQPPELRERLRQTAETLVKEYAR